MKFKSLNVGVIGLGTVGIGVVKCLIQNKKNIGLRAGREINIFGVSAKNRKKKREFDISGLPWYPDPIKLSQEPDVDVVIELIGGEEEPAKSIIEKSLLNSKHVVTANKALIAHHGHYLALIAEEQNVSLYFEAAVAGGIPITKVLRESLAGNNISKVFGVINGTCNYILTRMEAEDKDYSSIFKEAQGLGYVEKDPTLDVGGIDSAHKISILSSLAFSSRINFENVSTKGIENISLLDIKNANSLGYRIKLMGVAIKSSKGIYQEVEPCLVPKDSLFGKIEGGTNIVMVESDYAEQTNYIGKGAGTGPTASAVISDLIDIARGNTSPPFGMKASSLEIQVTAAEEIMSCFYLRFSLTDKPGTLAQLAGILGKNNISIYRMRQLRHEDENAPVLIVTHPTTKTLLKASIDEITKLNICKTDPMYIKIEEI